MAMIRAKCDFREDHIDIDGSETPLKSVGYGGCEGDLQHFHLEQKQGNPYERFTTETETGHTLLSEADEEHLNTPEETKKSYLIDNLGLKENPLIDSPEKNRENLGHPHDKLNGFRHYELKSREVQNECQRQNNHTGTTNQAENAPT